MWHFKHRLASVIYIGVRLLVQWRRCGDIGMNDDLRVVIYRDRYNIELSCLLCSMSLHGFGKQSCRPDKLQLYLYDRWI